MAESGYPGGCEARHGVRGPGASGSASGGEPQFIEPLARAAAAVGVAGIFIEVHDRPDHALSDGANALPLDRLAQFLERVRAIDELVRKFE